MRKVISFSVFGTKKLYLSGALKNIQLAKQIFPDWAIWFYVSDDVPRPYRVKYENAGVKLIEMGSSTDRAGAFWRFYAADEADIVIFRDADSRLLERDKIAVDEWLSSGKLVHVIRDNPLHHRNGEFPIQAGMWGCLSGLGLGDRMKKWPSFDDYGQDEHFLRENVWPIAVDDGFVHDSFTKVYLETIKHIIRHSRLDYSYIGENYIIDKKNRDWPRKPFVRQRLAHALMAQGETPVNDPFVFDGNKFKDFRHLNMNGSNELDPKKVSRC